MTTTTTETPGATTGGMGRVARVIGPVVDVEFAADELPTLAFDHNAIVEYALWRLRTKLEYSRIARAFLGDTFTLTELRQVYEAVLGRELDPANFRRTVEASKTLVPTDEVVAGGRHRPPRLYRYDDRIELVDNGPLSHEKTGSNRVVS